MMQVKNYKHTIKKGQDTDFEDETWGRSVNEVRRIIDHVLLLIDTNYMQLSYTNYIISSFPPVRMFFITTVWNRYNTFISFFLNL